MISEALLALDDVNPVVSLAAAVNLLSAITGSASGGMSIALEALGPTYVERARAQNNLAGGDAPRDLYRLRHA